MDKTAHSDFSDMRRHIIICGLGGTSLYIAEELERQRPFTDRTQGDLSPEYVVIDIDEEEFEKERHRFPHMRFLIGDATEDAVLLRAGVAGAYGIFAVLAGNRDNLFITFTARQINPSIRVVARASDLFGMGDRLFRAGADSVVSPSFSGGLRLVSEMVRPNSTAFLDELLREGSSNRHIAEARLCAESSLCNKDLAALALPDTYHVQVIAIVAKGRSETLYNPPAHTVLRAGDTLMLFGETHRVDALSEIIAARGPSPS